MKTIEKSMKQFDLQEYLKNPNRKVVTRTGKDVRIVCIDENLDDHPIVVLLQGNFCENTCFYKRDGSWLNDIETSMDLFFASEKKEGWVNLFKINSTITTGEVYNTEEEAKSAAINSAIHTFYISTVKIEWEE